MNTQTQRDRDLMKAVRAVTATCDLATMTRQKIVEQAARMPAPSFYVGYERAYRVVSCYLRGQMPTPRTPTQQRWACIARRVRQLMDSKPGMSYCAALNEVLDNGDAPSFFLSPSRAIALFYKNKRQRIAR